MKNRFLFALTAVLALSACAPTVATRGNLLTEVKLAQIKPLASTRADVIQIWGPPTVSSAFDPNIWYYVGETTSQKGIFAPEVENRRLIRVTFDPNDSHTVAEVAELDPAAAKEIELVDRKTPTAGKEYTALQQFIGNLGKYNTDPNAKK